jgi:hypothetical protein
MNLYKYYGEFDGKDATPSLPKNGQNHDSWKI